MKGALSVWVGLTGVLAAWSLLPSQVRAGTDAGAAAAYAPMPGGAFRSILPRGGKTSGDLVIAPFVLQRTPVTNAQFLAFVRAHPEWQRGRAPASVADESYLQHWRDTLELGDQVLPEQPVTHVSWFAARAFCAARAARLPDWYEWEFAAAANEHLADARQDPAWQQRILAWYAKPSDGPLREVGGDAANVYGLHDLHGLVWEWVEDFNALFIGADNRNQGDPDILKFCGSGALSVEDRENYPVMMRLALLSSLKANATTTNLGFRCALPPRGAYHSDLPLETQSGVKRDFGRQGHVQIVTMFYTSCPMACPLTINTLHQIEDRLTPAQRARLEVLMVTFDSSHDTPQTLQRLAHERHIDLRRWTLARTDAADVRRLSALLDIPYRELPDGTFNHGSALILLDRSGHELARTARTGSPDPSFVTAVRRALAPEALVNRSTH